MTRATMCLLAAGGCAVDGATAPDLANDLAARVDLAADLARADLAPEDLAPADLALLDLAVDGATVEGGARDLGSNADLAPAKDLASPDASKDLAGVPDLRPDLQPGADLAGAPDLASALLDTLPGVWLIGWPGGLDHFSWVKFEKGGAARVLEAMGGAFTPYWPNCHGVGKWVLAAQPNTIQLVLPPGCNPASLSITFKSIQPHMGFWPMGALLDADLDGGAMGLNGYKFPDAQCDALLTQCKLP